MEYNSICCIFLSLKYKFINMWVGLSHSLYLKKKKGTLKLEFCMGVPHRSWCLLGNSLPKF
jgi:hypothetical protein